MGIELVVVGSIGLDDVETPFGSAKASLGGSAIYFSMAASYFARVGMVGVVGDDFPETAPAMLLRRGVDLEGLERRAGNTFRWGGRYGFDLNERETLFTELNVFSDFRPELPSAYRGAPFLFLGNIDPALQLHVLTQVERPSLIAMDTMNFWIHGQKGDLRKVLRKVDALLLNDSEARELTNRTNIVSAARAIAELGPRIVVIKRGEYGAMLFFEGEFFYAPAFPLEDVRDPTGAGDSFAGGFMGYLAQCGELTWDALCRATVAGSTLASFSVEAFSVERLRSLDTMAIQRRVLAFQKLTHFTSMDGSLRVAPGVVHP